MGFSVSPTGALTSDQKQEAKEEGIKAIVEQLNTAYDALTGPVKVTRDSKTKEAQTCSDLALPYSDEEKPAV